MKLIVEADLSQSLNQSVTLWLLSLFARLLPPWLAHPILHTWSGIRRILRVVDKTEKQLTHNLKIVFGKKYTKKERKEIARRCLYLRSLAVYDFYHYQHDLKGLRNKITVDENIASLLADYKENHQAAIAISPHFVCADIIGIELAQRVNQLQVISIANPGRSYQLDNQIRETYGCEITPASLSALRKGAETLKQGGFVATGIDRAFPEERIPNDFFGKPAYLPTYYVRLALRYNVPIIFFYGEVDRKGNYHMMGHDPIWLKEYPTLEEEVIENSKTIIEYTEASIRKHPEQWAMYHPLWADQFNNIERESYARRKKYSRKSKS